MVIRTYFDRNNTVIKNSILNTGLNPVTQLFYGGQGSEHTYSRFLFHFDTDRLKNLYTGGTYPDITKLTHTLRLTNTGAFDDELLGKTTSFNQKRACSFDLIVFKINQDWDGGIGYDFVDTAYTVGSDSVSTSPSNWIEAETGVPWANGSGVYSGSSSGITIGTIHFDKGNENIEFDITNYVNGILTGDTNYGLGLAFSNILEATETSEVQFVGFFTKHTQTFYEPNIESIYDNYISDDRASFYLDKPNKLYLYVNLGGEPTNLDSIPGVIIKDQDDIIYSSITSSSVTHVTKGVYSIDIIVPTTSISNECVMFTDTWTGISINGITRPDIELNFALKSSMDYYNIGTNDMLPKKFGFSVSGIKRDERINRGDIRKVLVIARIPYTVDQKELADSLQYRLYVREGRAEYTVIDFQDVEKAYNNNYFLLDTQSLVPNTYYIDLKLTSNQEVTTINDVMSFDIVSIANLREN